MPPVPVRKTKYRAPKAKRAPSATVEVQKRMNLLHRTPRKAKDFRNIGDTVQFVQPVYNGTQLLANVGEFARYEGEQPQLTPAGSIDDCAIKLKSGIVLYLPDDGKVFLWVD